MRRYIERLHISGLRLFPRFRRRYVLRRLFLRHDVDDNVADYVPPINRLVSHDVIEAELGSDHMVHRPCNPHAAQPVDRREAVLQRQEIDTENAGLHWFSLRELVGNALSPPTLDP